MMTAQQQQISHHPSILDISHDESSRVLLLAFQDLPPQNEVKLCFVGAR